MGKLRVHELQSRIQAMCIVDPLSRTKLLYSKQRKLGQAWPWRRSQEQGIRLTQGIRWIYVD